MPVARLELGVIQDLVPDPSQLLEHRSGSPLIAVGRAEEHPAMEPSRRSRVRRRTAPGSLPYEWRNVSSSRPACVVSGVIAPFDGEEMPGYQHHDVELGACGRRSRWTTTLPLQWSSCGVT